MLYDFTWIYLACIDVFLAGFAVWSVYKRKG